MDNPISPSDLISAIWIMNRWDKADVVNCMCKLALVEKVECGQVLEEIVPEFFTRNCFFEIGMGEISTFLAISVHSFRLRIFKDWN